MSDDSTIGYIIVILLIVSVIFNCICFIAIWAKLYLEDKNSTGLGCNCLNRHRSRSYETIA